MRRGQDSSFLNWSTVVLSCVGALLVAACGGDGQPSVRVHSPDVNGAVTALTADAGNIQTVQPGASVMLDGTQSSAPSDTPITYNWSFTAAPNGSGAALSDFASAKPTFVADVPGTYLVQLIISASGVTSSRDLVNVTARSSIPVTAQAFDHTGITSNCFTCHNGTIAPGKSATHIVTSNVCEACHSTEVFTPVVVVDHVEVIGACDTCHNGTIATGKSLTHIPTLEDCDACHSTASWMPAVFSHVGITGNCALCHNGQSATGKSPNHIATNADCNACHSTTTWASAIFDHSGIVDNCAACHNGTTAVGKPANHIPTTLDCSVCHNTTTWISAAFDHSGITNGCASCHNGLNAPGKSATHIPSTDVCEACHSTAAFRPVRLVDHTQVIGPCSQCHNNQIARGKPGDHIPTSQDCGACHSDRNWNPSSPTTTPAPPSSGTPAPPRNPPTRTGGRTRSAFDHGGISDGCVACHNGVLARGKPADHPPASEQCNLCHTTTTWDNDDDEEDDERPNRGAVDDDDDDRPSGFFARTRESDKRDD